MGFKKETIVVVWTYLPIFRLILNEMKINPKAWLIAIIHSLSRSFIIKIKIIVFVPSTFHLLLDLQNEKFRLIFSRTKGSGGVNIAHDQPDEGDKQVDDDDWGEDDG